MANAGKGSAGIASATGPGDQRPSVQNLNSLVAGHGASTKEADDDPLFLRIKEANASVLEPYAGASEYANHGERVVIGQRFMQAAGDMLLGWSHGVVQERHYYVRQLRDMKMSVVLETLDPFGLRFYAKICGRVLARAHARSSDAAVLAGYMGNSAVFDEAVAAFAIDYSTQTDRDYKLFAQSVRSGRLKAASE